MSPGIFVKQLTDRQTSSFLKDTTLYHPKTHPASKTLLTSPGTSGPRALPPSLVLPLCSRQALPSILEIVGLPPVSEAPPSLPGRALSASGL